MCVIVGFLYSCIKIQMYVRVILCIYLLVIRIEFDWEKIFVYLGLYCEFCLDYCEGLLCLNGGQCNNYFINFICICVVGFIGMWKFILKQLNLLLNVFKYGNLN